MIEYRSDKEKEILLHYAKLLENETVLGVINAGRVSEKGEVKAVAQFYWQMVDLSAEEDKEGSGKFEDMEKWLERVYTTLHIYFNIIGYGDIWNEGIP